MTIIAEYFREVTRLAASTRLELFNDVLKEIKTALLERRTIFLVGNGTSGAIASHFANDLMKNVAFGINNEPGFGMKVISLSDNMPFFTATSNDISLDMAYTYYLNAYASPDDLMIIFSSEKPHKNIIEVAKSGYKRGLKIVSLTGTLSGELSKSSHVLYEIESTMPEQIEDIYSFLCHCWAKMLGRELTGAADSKNPDNVINKDKNDFRNDRLTGQCALSQSDAFKDKAVG